MIDPILILSIIIKKDKQWLSIQYWFKNQIKLCNNQFANLQNTNLIKSNAIFFTLETHIFWSQLETNQRNT